MNKHTVNLLADAFPQYSDEEQLQQLPQEWLHAVNELFCDLRDLQKLEPDHHPLDAIRPYVDVQWMRVDGRWRVYVRTTEPAFRWTDHQTRKLVEAIERFQDASQEASEEAGHAGTNPEAARVEALSQEVRDLFPEVHGSAINLNVPDHLFDLLASTLRSIHKLVVAEDIVGKVLITRVEIDDGALYVRVRYVELKAVFMGVQMAVNEMISDLEVLSDEATRKHHGGSDAS